MRLVALWHGSTKTSPRTILLYASSVVAMKLVVMRYSLTKTGLRVMKLCKGLGA